MSIPTDPKRAFKGIWIPARIWEAEDITWTEKCLLAQIDSYSEKDEGCFASAAYLAKSMRTTPGNIRFQLHRLTTKGYLQSTTWDGITRVLKVIKGGRKGGGGSLVPANDVVSSASQGSLVPANATLIDGAPCYQNGYEALTDEKTPKNGGGLIKSTNKETVPPISPPKGDKVSDAAKELVKSFREKFSYYTVTDSKQTAKELKAAQALLALASAEEVFNLATAALSDPFPGRRSWVANLRNIAAHLSELRAQFSGAPTVPAPTPEKVDWNAERTDDEIWADWDEYVATCKAEGTEPKPIHKPPFPRPPKMPQDVSGGIHVPPTPSLSRSVAPVKPARQN